MGTLNRAFCKIKNWLTSPARNIGTGMPTHRTMPTPAFAEKSSTDFSSTDFGCELKKRSKNRRRDEIARASRKRNR